MRKFNTQINKIFTTSKQESSQLNEGFWDNVKTAFSEIGPVKTGILAKKSLGYDKVITDFEAILQEITQLATELEKIKPKTPAPQNLNTEKVISFNRYLIEAQPGPDTWVAAGDPNWWNTPSTQNTPAQNTPTQNTPTQNTPTQNTPAQNIPVTTPQLSELRKKIGSYYPKVIELQNKCTAYIETIREYLIHANKTNITQAIPRDLWSAEARLNATLTKIQKTITYLEREAADFIQKAPPHPVIGSAPTSAQPQTRNFVTPSSARERGRIRRRSRA